MHYFVTLKKILLHKRYKTSKPRIQKGYNLLDLLQNIHLLPVVHDFIIKQYPINYWRKCRLYK